MFLKEFENSRKRYFISYDSFDGCDICKAFNSCGIMFIEGAYSNDGLFIVIKNKKIVANLYTSVHKKNILYPKIIKNVFRSIIEESLRGIIIPI